MLLILLIVALQLLAIGRASPPPPLLSGLSFMVDPTDPVEFLTHYYEKRVLHHDRNASNENSKMFSFAALDVLLPNAVSAVDASSNKMIARVDCALVKRVLGDDGEWWSGSVPGEVFEEKQIRAAFRNGFTVVLNKVDRRNSNVGLLSRHLENELGFVVQANVYLTPPGQQGFEYHFDQMETFVLQVEGRKRWKVYNSLIELPRQEQKYKPSKEEIANLQLVDDFVLNRGDILYMTRGVVHEAMTLDNAPSMHVTIGIDAQFGTWEAMGHVFISQLKPTDVDLDFAISTSFCGISWRQALHYGWWLAAHRFVLLRSSFPLTAPMIKIAGDAEGVQATWSRAVALFQTVFLNETIEAALPHIASEAVDSYLTKYVSIPKNVKCHVEDVGLELLWPQYQMYLLSNHGFAGAAASFRDLMQKRVNELHAERQASLVRHKQKALPI